MNALRKTAEVYPKQLAELEKELATARGTVESERERLLDIERQRRSMEQSISEEKEKVKKWESRLSEQRSTREYAALAREIDIAKKANVTMAEELIELGKTLVTARDAVRAKEQEFVGRQEDIVGKMNELKGKLADLDSQVKGFEAKRSDASRQVDANLLRRYEAVRKKKMPVLVAVLPSGTCAGCNMNVPPQLYNTLSATLGTDVCPSCNRIIYAQAALEPPEAKQ